MALNKKKVANKSKADALLESMELTRPASATNATQKIVSELNEIESDSTLTGSLDKLGRTDKGLGLNQNGTYRQSNAGRKKTTRRRRQVAVTLDPDFLDAVDAATQERSRSTASYMSEFLERHKKELLDFINK